MCMMVVYGLKKTVDSMPAIFDIEHVGVVEHEYMVPEKYLELSNVYRRLNNNYTYTEKVEDNAPKIVEKYCAVITPDETEETQWTIVSGTTGNANNIRCYLRRVISSVDVDRLRELGDNLVMCYNNGSTSRAYGVADLKDADGTVVGFCVYLGSVAVPVIVIENQTAKETRIIVNGLGYVISDDYAGGAFCPPEGVYITNLSSPSFPSVTAKTNCVQIGDIYVGCVDGFEPRWSPTSDTFVYNRFGSHYTAGPGITIADGVVSADTDVLAKVTETVSTTDTATEATEFYLKSSTADSTKRFKITVDDAGALTVNQYIEEEPEE